MAQQDKKQLTKAFLQKMEQQRLSKPCRQAIDLRGRVNGECQAYEFGEVTHYLDDRGYLLAKQLLARYDGRYTLGVYETLLKALKKLDQEQDEIRLSKPAPVTKPEYVKVDWSLTRSEQRVIYSTPVRIRLNDMLYNGSTIDISPSAMRVSLKRSYSLDVGDQIQLELVKFFEREQLPFLQRLPFKIIKVNHGIAKTTLVLTYIDQKDETISEWLDNWIKYCAKHKSIDIDDLILNQLSDSYLHLWMKKFGSPLFWLNQDAPNHPLQASHLSSVAAELLNKLPHTSSRSAVEMLPLSLLNSTESDLLVVLLAEQCWAAPLSQTATILVLLGWHKQNPESRTLLLRHAPITLDISKYEEQLEQIKAIDEEAATELTRELQQIQQLAKIVDISPLCRHVPDLPTVTAEQLSAFEAPGCNLDNQTPVPHALTQQIKRGKERFFVRTPIAVQFDGQQFQAETIDVSTDGLSLVLNDPTAIKVNQRVSIDFDRWQTLTKKVKLKAIPYQVKNKRHWNRKIYVGLQRITATGPKNMNEFFDGIIAKNRDSLKQNHNDVIEVAKSTIFIDALKPTLKTIPIFLGMDSDGQRSIEVVAETKANQASKLPSEFWQAFKELIVPLSTLFKSISSKNRSYYQSAVYAYLDKQGQWQVTLEEKFANEQQKIVFIQRAKAASQRYFFQAEMIPLSSAQLTEDDMLASAFMSWHTQRANRVKQIRHQLNNLFGIIELNDVSELINTLYPQT